MKFVIAFLLASTIVFAQLTTPAQYALEAGQEAAAEARLKAKPAFPDDPLWAEAIHQGQLAARLAPDAPEPIKFLAEIYSETRWYVRSWETWLTYKSLVGELDEASLNAATDIGTTLAYLRYQEGDRERALQRYQELTELNPSDPRAYFWAGRILLEEGNAGVSVPFLEKAAELDEGNEGISYYLDLAKDQISHETFNQEARASFYKGIQLYEVGELDLALEQFQTSSQADPTFKEAFAWAGQTSLDLNLAQMAQWNWRRVVNLDPSDERASYFLVLSEDQQRWGYEAVAAFREGVAQYDLANLEKAQRQFQRATEANPEYAAAWGWLGRTYFEQMDFSMAQEAYTKATNLQPENEVLKYFLDLSLERLQN